MRKWAIWGLVSGATFFVLTAGLLTGLWWYYSIPTPWRTMGLSASGGEIGILVSAVVTTGEIKTFKGYRVSYTVKNDSNRDMNFSTNSLVKVRNLSGALDELAVPVSLSTSYIPARHSIELHVEIHQRLEMPSPDEKEFRKKIRDALSMIGLEEKTVSGLAVLDSQQHFELQLPKPFWPSGGARVYVDKEP